VISIIIRTKIIAIVIITQNDVKKDSSLADSGITGVIVIFSGAVVRIVSFVVV